MTSRYIPNIVRASTILLLATLLYSLVLSRAEIRAQPAEQKANAKRGEVKYQEALECKRCHTRPTRDDIDNKSLDFVLLTEYAVWKTYDKHAQAYAVLEGPRGKAMADILHKDVRDFKTGCMNCHAMSNLFGERTVAELEKKRPDGVSCGGCHGPSKDWLSIHNSPRNPDDWRLKPPEWKAEKGFHDLRDPVTRATLCMSCHIGNAAEGKVITHAMFAAGHPPLPPIEIATFSHNEPQHWRDSKDVPFFKEAKGKIKEYYHLENVQFQRTQWALIGSVVALRETMKLVRDRAQANADNPLQRWPEFVPGVDEPAATVRDNLRAQIAERWPEFAMAHSDCFACHHELKYPGFRQQRGFGYQLSKGAIRTVPGRPLVRAWPTSLLEISILQAGRKEKADALGSRLDALVHAVQDRPFGTPQAVSKAAQDLISWCDELIADLNKTKYDRESVRKLLVLVCRLYTPTKGEDGGSGAARVVPDFEAARQIVSLVHVAYKEWQAKAPGDVDIDRILKQLADQVNLEPYTKRDDRLNKILDIVRKVSEEKAEGMKEFTAYLADIGNQQALERLTKNNFLRSIQDLSNEEFTKGILQPDVIKDLQKFSNEELTSQLNSVANYDPAVFGEHLEALAKRIEAKK